MKKCCVTGSRPQTLKFFMKYNDKSDSAFLNYKNTISSLIKKAVEEGFNYFISGGALGVDLDFAEAVDNFKNFTHKKIFLEIAVPCKNQCLKWQEADKIRYNKIVSKADYVTLVSKEYTFECMQKRNEYMVDSSEKVFAFWHEKKYGGTWNTINYAINEKREVEIIKLSMFKKN